MKNKTKIAILGIGGVGGYFGGKLAAKYSASEDFEIIFIARGENKKAIKENGLKLITPKNEEIVFANIITDNPDEIGAVDYLVCCTKSYHLESALEGLKPCISENTVILPFLNGIDARERIEKLYPKAEIWDGCVYIMVRLLDPGVVKELSNIHKFHFGSINGTKDKLKLFEKTLLDAGIDTHLSENIEQTIWDKFLLISAIASLTSYLDLSIQEIFSDDKHKQTLLDLMYELKAIGEAKQITFSDGIIRRTVSILEKTPTNATSSMHSDFKRGGKTEYQSLTEYVVKQGEILKVPTPIYKKIAKELSTRTDDGKEK